MKNSRGSRSVCRSCGAPVIWTLTASGKRMPVDAEPRADGTYVLAENQDGSFAAQRYSHFVHQIRQLYASHFATCPHAGMWRKEETR